MNQEKWSKTAVSWPLLVLAIGGALILAGCGGDDDGADGGENVQAENQAAGQEAGGGESGEGTGEGASEPAPSKAAYIEAADVVCQEVQNRTRQAVNQRFSGEDDGSRGEADFSRELVTDVIIPSIEDQINGLRSLSGPADAERATEILIAKFKRVIEVAEADPLAYATGSAKVVSRAERTAERLGFGVCGPLA